MSLCPKGGKSFIKLTKLTRQEKTLEERTQNSETKKKEKRPSSGSFPRELPP